MVALPGVTEKGYIDVRLSVASPGGHSSIPPKHTVGFFSFLFRVTGSILTHSQSIGLLAALITEIEANPVAAKLSRGTLCPDLHVATLITSSV